MTSSLAVVHFSRRRLDSRVHCILRDVINAMNFLFIGPSFDSMVFGTDLNSAPTVTKLNLW